MARSVRLFTLAIGEHEGLVILGLMNQVQGVQMLFLRLTTEACSTAVTALTNWGSSWKPKREAAVAFMAYLPAGQQKQTW